jgi:Circularly permutated YpsA SLOG family
LPERDLQCDAIRMLKIVSGGQTGVDRAALDVAIEKSIPCGGWCPKGGWAEDLPKAPGLLAVYRELRETPIADPHQRTAWNVRDSDRLLVLLDHRGLCSSGTELTILRAHELDRPLLVLDLDEEADVDRAVAWLSDSQQAQLTVCIAGPRESEASGIYAAATPFLRAVLDRVTLRERENHNARRQDK